MNISRFLRPDLIKLDLETRAEYDPQTGELTKRRIREAKVHLLAELVELMEQSGHVGNPSKLINDLYNREKKASTAIGHGIALPHVRTYQAKELIIAVGCSRPGIDFFDAPDGKPVHLFFVMAAPPYNDALYLKVFKSLAQNLRFDYFRERLLNAVEEYDIVRAFKDME